MLCHWSGRSPAGGTVMPWPLMPSLAHSPASCPGTGLSGGSTPAACSAATMRPGPSPRARSSALAAAGGPGLSCAKGAAAVRIRAAIASSRSSPGLCPFRVTMTSGTGICGPKSKRVAGSLAAVVRSSQRIWCGGSGRSRSSRGAISPCQLIW
jgi:hypothetical protein